MKSPLRGTITINGKKTVELDIGSSQFTIAYGLAKEPLPPGDLYNDTKFPRDVVKALVTAMIGKGDRPIRWPSEFAKEYLKVHGKRIGKVYKLKDAADRVARMHPLLLRLGEFALDAYRLQYIESQILIRSMLRLIREHGIPSLPLHDCLIVVDTDQAKAKAILEEEFHREVGLLPVIKVK